jgi:hypothetical protein
MKSPDELALAAELRALRPTPRPEFATELDARAAAGFPRKRRGVGAFGERLSAVAGGATSRLRISPRRLLAPAGGLAVATVLVVAVVVVSFEENSDQDPISLNGRNSEAATQAPAHGPVQFSEEPTVVPGPHKATSSDSAAAGSVAGGFEGSSSRTGTSRPETGPYASQASHRDVERSAEMVLGTDPTDVRRAAGKVFEAVHAYDGIVLESAIEDGGEGEAGASFELLIPSAKLGDALASFSSIAEVRSRQESTADVTAKTVGLGERLQDSRATISGLLDQLADADTDGERAAAEAELHGERLRAAALRANLADLQRRANLSQVSLKIESGEEGAAPADENGSWGIGDALDDAGHILEVAAGVALIGLAILAPFALLALIAWLTRRGGVRRVRERALS